jgi:3-hydroxybutyrate dehydrogenase
VIAADIDLDAAEITAAAVRDAGGEAKAVACDVAQEAQVAAWPSTRTRPTAAPT